MHVKNTKSAQWVLICALALLLTASSVPAEPNQDSPPPVGPAVIKDLMDKARKALDAGNEAQAQGFLKQLVNLGAAAWEAEDAATAESIFQQILRLDPSQPDALLAMAGLLRQTDRPGWAIEYYTRFLRVNPADPAGYFGRGTAYLSMETFSLAIQDLKHLIEDLDPGHIDGLTNLALALRGKASDAGGDVEQFAEAVQYMRRAVQLAQNNPSEENRRKLPDLRYRLGALILQHQQALAKAQPDQADFSEAIRQTETAIAEARELMQAQPMEMAYIQLILQCFDVLSRIQQSAAELHSDDPKPYLALSELATRRTTYQTRRALIMSANYLKRALQIDAANAEAHERLARVYADLGAFEQAIEQINEAVRIAPTKVAYKDLKERLIAATQPATQPLPETKGK